MLNTNAHAILATNSQFQARVEIRESDPAANLVDRFGDRMSSTEVAAALGYSHTYFIKKIGSKDHNHLDWVMALRPARVRMGRTTKYKTKAVAKLMVKRGLL